jgi:Ni2+-binding GTPase involved in maturation of urease and hydrogenase
VVTKLDLAGPVGCDLALLVRNIHAVRPGMPVLTVSARSGAGVAELERMLLSTRTQPLAAHAV